MIVLLAGCGICIRFLPHMPNATPLAAIALASGHFLDRRLAWILPLTVLFLSDAVVGFYSLPIMASVYGSFFAIGVLCGWCGRRGGVYLAYGACVPSLIFFLITNMAVWLFSPWYIKNLSGLLLSYEMGLPFLRSMLIGDIAYSVLIFSAILIVQNLEERKPLLAHEAVV